MTPRTYPTETSSLTPFGQAQTSLQPLDSRRELLEAPQAQNCTPGPSPPSLPPTTLQWPQPMPIPDRPSHPPATMLTVLVGEPAPGLRVSESAELHTLSPAHACRVPPPWDAYQPPSPAPLGRVQGSPRLLHTPFCPPHWHWSPPLHEAVFCQEPGSRPMKAPPSAVAAQGPAQAGVREDPRAASDTQASPLSESSSSLAPRVLLSSSPSPSSSSSSSLWSTLSSCSLASVPGASWGCSLSCTVWRCCRTCL